MQRQRTEAASPVKRPFCDQLTRRDERCEHRATWQHRDKRTGEMENYCTLHANYYGVQRRGGEKLP